MVRIKSICRTTNKLLHHDAQAVVATTGQRPGFVVHAEPGFGPLVRRSKPSGPAGRLRSKRDCLPMVGCTNARSSVSQWWACTIWLELGRRRRSRERASQSDVAEVAPPRTRAQAAAASSEPVEPVPVRVRAADPRTRARRRTRPPRRRAACPCSHRRQRQRADRGEIAVPEAQSPAGLGALVRGHVRVPGIKTPVP